MKRAAAQKGKVGPGLHTAQVLGSSVALCPWSKFSPSKGLFWGLWSGPPERPGPPRAHEPARPQAGLCLAAGSGVRPGLAQPTRVHTAGSARAGSHGARAGAPGKAEGSGNKGRNRAGAAGPRSDRRPWSGAATGPGRDWAAASPGAPGARPAPLGRNPSRHLRPGGARARSRVPAQPPPPALVAGRQPVHRPPPAATPGPAALRVPRVQARGWATAVGEKPDGHWRANGPEGTGDRAQKAAPSWAWPWLVAGLGERSENRGHWRGRVRVKTS